jgi:hypothetical protein
MLAKKHFEINPNHPVMKELLQRIKTSGGSPDKDTEELADLIYDIALLNSGFSIDDPTRLNAKVQKLMKVGVGLDADAECEEYEVDLDEDPAEEVEEKIPDDYDEDEKKEVDDTDEDL